MKDHVKEYVLYDFFECLLYFDGNSREAGQTREKEGRKCSKGFRLDSSPLSTGHCSKDLTCDRHSPR